MGPPTETTTTTTPATAQTVTQPTRDADHNRDLVERANRTPDTSLLPSLNDGITLLDMPANRDIPVLQSLVLDHLLMHAGPAVWIDTNGYATTTHLARIAPSRRLLDRIHVARAFTAYQHYSAVRDLAAAIEQGRAVTNRSRTDEPSTTTPALIVVPALDGHYRSEDGLPQAQAATLQARALATLQAHADADADPDKTPPVLVTRTADDTWTAPIARAADHQLICEQTRMGPRIVGEDTDTLVYPVGDGTVQQTTFAYWRQLLAARATQVADPSPAPTEAPTDESKTGVLATGDEPGTVDPLADAWTAGGR